MPLITKAVLRPHEKYGSMLLGVAGAILFMQTGSGDARAAARGLVAQDVPAATPVVPPLALAPLDAGRVRFAAKSADSMRFRQLGSYYVGKSVVDAVRWDNVDLADMLRKSWERKMRTFQVTPATTKSVDGIVARFRAAPHTVVTLPEQVRRYDVLLDTARNGLDWPALCARYSVPSERCVRLQYMTGRITGQMLTAYSMTELFPGTDGARNWRNYQTLLTTAGPEFVNSIPALGDRLLSAGPFQWTSYAVKHDATGRQGASIVDEFAKVHIPGSVVALRPDDQPVAALYFSTYNLMRLVRGLTPGQYGQLRDHSPLKPADLTTYMAAAHHNPGGAIAAARRWLDGGCARPLTAYLRGRLVEYGAKSAANLDALKKHADI